MLGFEPWDAKATSYEAIGEQIKASGAQSVYLGGIVCNNGVKLLKDLRAVLGPDVVFVGPDGWTPYSATLGAGSAAQGMYVSYAGQPLEKLGPTGKKFMAQFRAYAKIKGSMPPYAVYQAQAAQIMLDAIARSDGTRSSVTKQMFKTNVKNGIMGTFRFDKNGDIVPLKCDQLRPVCGQDGRLRVRGRHQGQGVERPARRPRETTLGKGLRALPQLLIRRPRSRPTFRRMRSRSRAADSASSIVVPAIGLILVALVLAWLGINLAKDWDEFFRIFLIGLTNGALYALVALGYTLVYGILELINFAHGDVFMIGGMIAATVALSMFSLAGEPSSRHPRSRDPRGAADRDGRLRPAQRDHRARRLQAASARTAPRAADHGDRGVVHPPGRRSDLEGLAAGRDAAVAPGRRRSSRSAPARTASSTRGIASSRS